MHRFWKGHIKPIVEILAPTRILEIGAASGRNTRPLLEYCSTSGARLDVIDPAPAPALREILANCTEKSSLHGGPAFATIPSLRPPELVLLAGDPNWFAVYNELLQLYLHAEASGQTPPVILVHNTAWPYARRDMYHNPDAMLLADRHPYAFRGMIPDRSELNDAGMNGRHANAMHEGGPRNGVLTAVEDFQTSCGVKSTLHLLPFFNGLGILVPEARMTPSLQTTIDGFFSVNALLETCQLLERNEMNAQAELAALRTVLSNRTIALARLNELLETRQLLERNEMNAQAELAALRTVLSNRKNPVQRTIKQARLWTTQLRSRAARFRS